MPSPETSTGSDVFKVFQRPGNPVQSEDLGLGAGFSTERYLNRDGTFNITKRGLPLLRQLHVYHSLITMSWPRFVAMCVCVYLGLAALFAFAYTLCGPGAVTGTAATNRPEQLLEAFFLSVQTLSTIGYGSLSPGNLAANLVATVEAIFGLFATALATGVVFARFARPRAKLTFSRNAVIAPFQDGQALMLRVANHSRSLLSQVTAAVVLLVRDRSADPPRRTVATLALERDTIMFLPLHWVLVHPITEDSPLHGLTEEAFLQMDAEFLVLLTGQDETYAQTVNVRISYVPAEVRWGAKFTNMYLPRETGRPLVVDLGKIHDIEAAELPNKP